ncbi:hypothetical protein H310_04531 [Aphanomyces invadans]|uniref:EGF-like domain-containing protein n=1 Tax=Aphanomyces invadans TaxID=157072 RepID=A0A024UCN6_9STRA|nr:hypothetical protein H310_04531 [Aphanomyces invadans]ETW04186.1 hypothetical protein H310_04531 [Aphanomyces invadans]|eukprot:XP_008867142.1 hypothetical protein H310_04531 [Aphanomyces invadans]
MRQAWLLGAATVGFVVGGHDCIHDVQLERFTRSVDMTTLTNEQELETSGSRRLTDATTLFQPIRISFDTSRLTSDPGYLCTQAGQAITRDGSSYTCTQNDILTKEKSDFILSVMIPAVTTYFSSVLSVQRVSGNLIIQGLGCQANEWACCANTIPPYLKTTGIANTDFLIHVTARPTSGAVLAWALPCNIDQYGRPISGQANFGPNRLDTQSGSRAGQIGTAIHEITHALGFSSSRFADFRQPLNGPLWGYSNVVSQTQQNGIFVSKVITPQVVKQAKQQFNCPDWPGAGAELENGPTGSSDFSSHWEKRLFNKEYMTATSSANPVYSAMTLAFFEDTGWYTANYSMAQALPWGYLEGCSFATGQCSEWSNDYFCSAAGEHCSATRDAKGYCDINTYTSSIPSGFQYFKNAKLGGQDTFSDYCPTYQGYSNGACSDTTTYLDADMGEALGAGSKCFQSTLTKGSSRASTPACYPVIRCGQGNMYIRVGGKEVACPLAGGDVSVPGFQGTVRCPPGNKMCQLLQTQCSGQGILMVDGSCSCNPGFSGSDCSLKDCPLHNGVECNGRGSCDRRSGTCRCDAAYTGLSCSELLCPVVTSDKFLGDQCSGHGACNGALGTCTCSDGYTGKACECVPGCTSCSNGGSCDCLTGSCVCPSGFFGAKCELAGDAPIETLVLDANATTMGQVPAKTTSYFKVLLNSSSSDITVLLTSTSGDADLYGSFLDTYPSPKSTKSTLFVSNANRHDRLDAIQLCGTLGTFPRAMNDTFRFCSQANALLVQGAPGYFYVSVFGFAASTFELKVVSDPCVNEVCSNHGTCGKYYAGVCACDRSWSGERCSTPRCRPDCVDFNNCNAPTSSATVLTSGLRNTTDCYGNGECRVVTVHGVDQPTCVCDEAFSFANPTDDQSICKVPLPSIRRVQHFADPFVVHGDTMQYYVGVGEWTMYTLTVKPEWQYVYVELKELSDGSDPLVLVRKTKLPSLNASGNPYPLQAVDAAAWTSAASKQRVLLTRASSTLSDGLLYIGVYNTRYGRNPLAYQLTVEANSTCDIHTTDVCARGSTVACAVALPTMCQCASTAQGPFCDHVNITHSRVNADVPTQLAPVVVHEGSWQYWTFDVADPAVEFVRVELTTGQSSAAGDEVKPVLMVRGPLEPGFPSLDLSSAFDFNAVTTPVKNGGNHTVLVPVSTSCAGPRCFKVAVYNKLYSGNVIQANVTLVGLKSAAQAYAVPDCTLSGVGDAANCNDRGMCVQVGDQPTCKCKNGWSGMTCNAPRAFAISQLWSAATGISLLCSVCNATFTLSNGAMVMFTLPQSMQPNTGLELRVKSNGGIVSPNMYVSEATPRSLYDFAIMSFSDESEEVVQLTNRPFQGHFWVAIYSEAPLGMDANATNTPTTFTIQSRVIPLVKKTVDKRLITQTSFLGAVMSWLTTAPLGIVLFSLLLIFLGLTAFYFVWRTFRSPDNQDSAISTLAAELGNRANEVHHVEAGLAAERVQSPLRMGSSTRSDDAPTPSAPPLELDVEMAPIVRFS